MPDHYRSHSFHYDARRSKAMGYYLILVVFVLWRGYLSYPITRRHPTTRPCHLLGCFKWDPARGATRANHFGDHESSSTDAQAVVDDRHFIATRYGIPGTLYITLRTDHYPSAMSTTSAVVSSSVSGLSAPRPPKAHSCVLCSQRKVKCNKIDPCSNCSRAGVPCVYRAPAPPRRRKKKSPEGDLLSRLQRAEELLRSYGAKLNVPDQNMPESLASGDSLGATRSTPGEVESKVKERRVSNGEKGRLIVKDGKSRYLER